MICLRCEIVSLFNSCFCYKMLPIVKFCRLTSRLRLHTCVNRFKHSPVFNLQGEMFNFPYQIPGAIKMSEDWYVLDGLGQHMRHSSDPNCVVVDRCVIATRDLNPGDELTYDSNQEITDKYGI